MFDCFLIHRVQLQAGTHSWSKRERPVEAGLFTCHHTMYSLLWGQSGDKVRRKRKWVTAK